MRKLRILLLAVLLVPALASAKTLEDLLVEKGVITKGEARAAMAGGDGAKVYWNNGTRIEFPSEGFAAQINTLIRTRYTFTDYDEDVGTSNTSGFDVTDARIMVSGNALHNEFSYYLNADMVGSEDSTGAKSPALLDAYIAWQACDWASVQMGQSKTGFGRQYNTSEQYLQFADRSNVSDYFTSASDGNIGLGRQAGALAKTTWADGQLMLNAGIFNGESTGEGINRSAVDTRHTGVVTLRWNVMGDINSYQESDIDWTEDWAASLGASYAYSDRGGSDANQDSIAVDANAKYQGFSFNAEYFVATVDPDEGDSLEPNGFYAQAGYFFQPKELELAARYGYLDCDNGTASGQCTGLDNVNEVGVSINYYWWKHNLKGQIGYDLLNQDVRGLSGDSSNVNTSRWLVQLSSYF
ncbi:MAG: OprO/OprP family phosphate-selective porin [Oligoflexia bacterium]|nr:OprO/OprP family phosphate-selective porin [Oligoflexia bacterium]